MPTNLLTKNIWTKITQASKQSRGYVAVAYFGKGASKLLPMKAGSTLVLDMSDAAVKSGQTCPADVIKLMNKGVNVFTVSNLHAKVFAFSKIAFVGSTNASFNSANGLIEAVTVSSDKQLIKDIREFVKSLTGEPVTPHYARIQESKYKPPRFTGKPLKGPSTTPKHNIVRTVQLKLITYTEDEEKASTKGRPIARKKLNNTKTSTINEFVWKGKRSFKNGEIVIQIINEGKKGFMVSPPGRVVYVRAVKPKSSKPTIVFLEIPKKYKRKNLNSMKQRVDVNTFNALQKTKVLNDVYIAHSILQQWSNV